jgi:ribosomal protein S18 acetylase RimI-like enzyme
LTGKLFCLIQDSFSYFYLSPGIVKAMEKQIIIEKARPEDADFIIELGRRTFVETYGEFTDPGNVELYVNESFTDKVIAEELSTPHARFYIAYLEGMPVGFCKLRNNRQPKAIEGRTLEVQRIYVLKEFQGYHVGKALMEKVKQIAREERYKVIWLQVWQKNEKAIRFYQNAGFVVYDTTGFQFGKEIQQDYLMRYDLYF